MSSLTNAVQSTDLLSIIRNEPFETFFAYSSDSPEQLISLYQIKMRLKTQRGTTIWTKTETAGLTKLATGWLLTLSTTDTNVEEGLYLLVVELKEISNGVPIQTSIAVEIAPDLI